MYITETIERKLTIHDIPVDLWVEVRNGILERGFVAIADKAGERTTLRFPEDLSLDELNAFAYGINEAVDKLELMAIRHKQILEDHSGVSE